MAGVVGFGHLSQTDVARVDWGGWLTWPGWSILDIFYREASTGWTGRGVNMAGVVSFGHILQTNVVRVDGWRVG